MAELREEGNLTSLLKKTSWYDILEPLIHTSSFEVLNQFLFQSYREETPYPPLEHLFSAFKLTSFENVKVIILGQDPYHEPGQAHGLAFSVPIGTVIPPSLANIFKELQADLGINPPLNGDLTSWAKQGVLLLNTVMTVQAHRAHSHKNKGWESFTDRTIQVLSQTKSYLVFVLWGAHAQEKIKFIDTQKHLVIQSSHPSPLSAYRTFFGSRPFSKINGYLESHYQLPIDWEL